MSTDTTDPEDSTDTTDPENTGTPSQQTAPSAEQTDPLQHSPHNSCSGPTEDDLFEPWLLLTLANTAYEGYQCEDLKRHRSVISKSTQAASNATGRESEKHFEADATGKRSSVKVSQSATGSRSHGSGEMARTDTICIRDYIDLSKFAVSLGFHVTAGKEPGHNPGSDHGKGKAIDVRTWDKPSGEIQRFIDDAKDLGIAVRDERTRPIGQKVWTGPHLHLSTKEPRCTMNDWPFPNYRDLSWTRFYLGSVEMSN